MHRTIYSLLLLLMTFPLLAQVTPAAAIDSMGRGINLGNSLEAPTQTAWGNPLTREEHFDAYVEAGFTNVRVPVKWDRHTGTTPPYTISASWLNRVEEIVDWGLERGLWIAPGRLGRRLQGVAQVDATTHGVDGCFRCHLRQEREGHQQQEERVDSFMHDR